MAYQNLRTRAQRVKEIRERRAAAAERRRRRITEAQDAAAADSAGLSPFELNRRESSLRMNRRRGDRSAGSGRENARGSGVSADISAVDGNVSRRDRGGIGAGERGANLTGFAGELTPGQIRGAKQTRAGKFPVYGKQMQAAQSFRSAFAQARGQGKKVFEWQGRKYTTDLA
jgi:hypothetical protein